MYTTKVNEAKKMEIYVLEYSHVYGKRKVGNREFSYVIYDSLDNSIEVVKKNLYDFVMESAKETTSPRGVTAKLHIREDEENEEEPFEIWTWGVNGNHPHKLSSFETEEEAQDELFRMVFDYDFETDDQRDTTYFSTQEEAEEGKIERFADWWSVDVETVKSILKWKMKAEKILERREEMRKVEEAKKNAAYNEIAKKYANLLSKIEGESYKDTAKRLSETIGEKIQATVFHKAVKLVRQ